MTKMTDHRCDQPERILGQAKYLPSMPALLVADQADDPCVRLDLTKSACLRRI